jgi:hypothetical protein
MDAPQLQQQVVPADALRLPDMKLQAGPREIEFEVELPKGAAWDEGGENAIAITSGSPQVVATGQARFDPHSMRFMIPATALRAGEALLTYDVKLAWVERTGNRCTDTRRVLQRVMVEATRGATVPWVHYKAQGNGTSTVAGGNDRHSGHLSDGEHTEQ